MSSRSVVSPESKIYDIGPLPWLGCDANPKIHQVKEHSKTIFTAVSD